MALSEFFLRHEEAFVIRCLQKKDSVFCMVRLDAQGVTVTLFSIFRPRKPIFKCSNGVKNDGYREPLPIRDFKRPVNLKRGLQVAYMCAYQLVWITAASTQALHANADFYGLMASNRL